MRFSWQKVTQTAQSVLFGPLLSPLRPGNVVLFHIGRSGSTVLGDMLQQHTRIFWDGEIYRSILPTGAANHDPGGDPIAYVRRRMRQAGQRYYGFEVKFFHLQQLNKTLAAYVDDLERLGFDHFVILERQNYLRKIVSSLIAHETGKFHQRKAAATQAHQVTINVEQVRIDRDEKPLLAFLHDYQAQFVELERLLQARRMLKLSYEADIAADPQLAYRKVCEFLNIATKPVDVRYVKTNPYPLPDLVANFGEVAQVLAGTPFAWMLEEER
ncbi:MAG: hypothetical protein KC443_21800 [Anaerolineales bacterium]|nr:hypothetical protein [Anaerolineales bacterium]